MHTGMMSNVSWMDLNFGECQSEVTLDLVRACPFPRSHFDPFLTFQSLKFLWLLNFTLFPSLAFQKDFPLFLTFSGSLRGISILGLHPHFPWTSQKCGSAKKSLPSQTQGQILAIASQNCSSPELLGPALLGHQSPRTWAWGQARTCCCLLQESRLA